MTTVFDFAVEDATGNMLSLSKFRGDVLVLMNVASRCSMHTWGMEALSRLCSRYSARRDVQILTFPCNQFGGQEPLTSQQSMALVREHAPCVLGMALVNLKGSKVSPLYAFLRDLKGAPRWNYTTYVCSRQGTQVRRFDPGTPAEKIEAAIDSYLEERVTP